MNPKRSHPFNVDVRRCRSQRDTFIWSINETGGVKHRSPRHYATFEEARLAMQQALHRLISEWHSTQEAHSRCSSLPGTERSRIIPKR